MTGMKFEVEISAEDIRQMAVERVSRTMQGVRGGVDEDGNYHSWEESNVLKILQAEVKARVAEILPTLIEEEIKTEVKRALEEGWKAEYGPQQNMRSVVTNFFSAETGGGYNQPRTTKVAALINDAVKQALQTDMAELLKDLRKTFESALTQRFTDAAARALRDAVGI